MGDRSEVKKGEKGMLLAKRNPDPRYRGCRKENVVPENKTVVKELLSQVVEKYGENFSMRLIHPFNGNVFFEGYYELYKHPEKLTPYWQAVSSRENVVKEYEIIWLENCNVKFILNIWCRHE